MSEIQWNATLKELSVWTNFQKFESETEEEEEASDTIIKKADDDIKLETEENISSATDITAAQLVGTASSETTNSTALSTSSREKTPEIVGEKSQDVDMVPVEDNDQNVTISHEQQSSTSTAKEKGKEPTNDAIIDAGTNSDVDMEKLEVTDSPKPEDIEADDDTMSPEVTKEDWKLPKVGFTSCFIFILLNYMERK